MDKGKKRIHTLQPCSSPLELRVHKIYNESCKERKGKRERERIIAAPSRHVSPSRRRLKLTTRRIVIRFRRCKQIGVSDGTNHTDNCSTGSCLYTRTFTIADPRRKHSLSDWLAFSSLVSASPLFFSLLFFSFLFFSFFFFFLALLASSTTAATLDFKCNRDRSSPLIFRAEREFVCLLFRN